MSICVGLEGYIELMQRCWAQNPEERPKFQEIIQELRCASLINNSHRKCLRIYVAVLSMMIIKLNPGVYFYIVFL